MKEKFYITTAIAYTSRKPHIGNTYEVVLTDAIARYKRLRGYDVFFLTGTDEHGQKIQDIAEETGVTPKQYVDGVAGEIRKIWDLMNSSYDKFIRTTDDYHVAAVQKIFKKLYDQGDIYKGEYEGLYCIPCESFFTPSQAPDGVCPDCGRKLSTTKEEAYFLKLSKYQDRLIEYIETHPDFIQPESRKKEMINNFLKPGLSDLCVSRSSFSWGIPVTFDEKHVIYVWIDALSNYITALGYSPDSKGELYNKYWPCDVHIIGKDILRFHTIYWPIMLMALGEPLPKQIFGHPWLLAGMDKMSKSRGNVMYADDLVRHFGVDAIRYYLLSEMPFAQDGEISYETIIARYNSDLANTLGNLVNRTVAMTGKYFGSVIPENKKPKAIDKELSDFAMGTVKTYAEKMDAFKVADALEAALSLAKRSNKYIDETTPWALAKDEAQKDRLASVLYNLLECIRITAVMLKPFMPETAEKIFAQINTDAHEWESVLTYGNIQCGKQLPVPNVLFARIDEKIKLEELAAENAPAPKEEEKTNEISIEDFAKIEIVAGKVLESKRVEGSDKLLVSQIDIGTKTVQVVSGIAKYYEPDDFVGKTVAVIKNLKPVKLCGTLSEGMVLAAANKKGLSVLTLDKDMPAGTKIS
ncbi:MAG: methionine--tRNA ligase [Clostridia bacterium]|nr:methionine--tRNA ligase [Clostridia bacterium]